jgi:hemin uptake protein HemP
MSRGMTVDEKYLLDADELYHFDTRGFLVKPGFLSRPEVAQLTESLAPLWTGADDDGTARVSTLTRSPALEDLACRIANEAGLFSTINQPFRLIESYALRRSDGSMQTLHNGRSNANRSAFGESHRAMWRDHTYHDGRLYCMMVKALIYLTDILTDDDGPFTLVEGSHKANYPFPLAKRDIKRGAGLTGSGTCQVHTRAGDLLLLNEALTHGSLAKSSPGPRLFIAFSYAPSFVSDYRKLGKDSAELTHLGFCE